MNFAEFVFYSGATYCIFNIPYMQLLIFLYITIVAPRQTEKSTGKSKKLRNKTDKSSKKSKKLNVKSEKSKTKSDKTVKSENLSDSGEENKAASKGEKKDDSSPAVK